MRGANNRREQNKAASSLLTSLPRLRAGGCSSWFSSWLQSFTWFSVEFDSVRTAAPAVPAGPVAVAADGKVIVLAAQPEHESAPVAPLTVWLPDLTPQNPGERA